MLVGVGVVVVEDHLIDVALALFESFSVTLLTRRPASNVGPSFQLDHQVAVL